MRSTDPKIIVAKKAKAAAKRERKRKIAQQLYFRNQAKRFGLR